MSSRRDKKQSAKQSLGTDAKVYEERDNDGGEKVKEKEKKEKKKEGDDEGDGDDEEDDNKGMLLNMNDYGAVRKTVDEYIGLWLSELGFEEEFFWDYVKIVNLVLLCVVGMWYQVHPGAYPESKPELELLIVLFCVLLGTYVILYVVIDKGYALVCKPWSEAYKLDLKKSRDQDEKEARKRRRKEKAKRDRRKKRKQQKKYGHEQEEESTKKRQQALAGSNCSNGNDKNGDNREGHEDHDGDDLGFVSESDSNSDSNLDSNSDSASDSDSDSDSDSESDVSERHQEFESIQADKQKGCGEQGKGKGKEQRKKKQHTLNDSVSKSKSKQAAGNPSGSRNKSKNQGSRSQGRSQGRGKNDGEEEEHDGGGDDGEEEDDEGEDEEDLDNRLREEKIESFKLKVPFSIRVHTNVPPYSLSYKIVFERVDYNENSTAAATNRSKGKHNEKPNQMQKQKQELKQELKQEQKQPMKPKNMRVERTFHINKLLSSKGELYEEKIEDEIIAMLKALEEAGTGKDP